MPYCQSAGCLQQRGRFPYPGYSSAFCFRGRSGRCRPSVCQRSTSERGTTHKLWWMRSPRMPPVSRRVSQPTRLRSCVICVSRSRGDRHSPALCSTGCDGSVYVVRTGGLSARAPASYHGVCANVSAGEAERSPACRKLFDSCRCPVGGAGQSGCRPKRGSRRRLPALSVSGSLHAERRSARFKPSTE